MYNFNVKVSNLDGFSFSMDKVQMEDENPAGMVSITKESYTELLIAKTLVKRLGVTDWDGSDLPMLAQTYMDKHGGHQEFEHIACNARLEVGVRIFETSSDGQDEDVYVAPLEAVLAKLGFEIESHAFFMAAYEVGKENRAKIHGWLMPGENSNADLVNQGDPDENPFSDAHIYAFLGAGEDNPAGAIPKIELKYNNTAVKDRCGICDRDHRPDLGIQLFVEGTWRPVCDACGEQYAPELVGVEPGVLF
jgi:hypothetical protein